MVTGAFKAVVGFFVNALVEAVVVLVDVVGVVVNSTPLIALGRIERLKLLQDVFGNIAIPQAVYEEVCKKEDNASALLKSNPDWIKVLQIRDTGAKKWFPVALHDGEVEVMILTEEMGDKLLVMDDLPARKHSIRLFGKSRVIYIDRDSGVGFVDIDDVLPKIEVHR